MVLMESKVVKRVLARNNSRVERRKQRRRVLWWSRSIWQLSRGGPAQESRLA
jgi:hypothetical protein